MAAKKRFKYVITQVYWASGNLDPMAVEEPILIVATQGWAERQVRKLMATARGGYDENGRYDPVKYTYKWNKVRSLVP